MRKVTDRPDLLVIDHLPWRAVFGVLAFLLAMLALGGLALARGGWAPGLGLILLGGGSALAALSTVAEHCRLTLDRTAGEATLTRRNFRGRRLRRYPLARIARAGTQSKLDWMWKPRLHRLVIHLDKGPGLPFSESWQAGSEPAEMARAINDWLARTSGQHTPS